MSGSKVRRLEMPGKVTEALGRRVLDAAVKKLKEDPKARRDLAAAAGQKLRASGRTLVEDFENDDFTRTKAGHQRFMGLVRALGDVVRRAN
jgi:hypothetical protein